MRKLTATKFLASPITVPIDDTLVDGTDFTSDVVVFAYSEFASITFYVKGANAGCSKEVVFKLVAFSSALGKWDTVEYLSYSVPANGTSEVILTIPFTPDVEKLKLLSIQNQEVVAGYTVDANVYMFIKEP